MPPDRQENGASGMVQLRLSCASGLDRLSAGYGANGVNVCSFRLV